MKVLQRSSVLLASLTTALSLSLQAQTVTRHLVESTPAITSSDRIEWIDLDQDSDQDMIAIYRSEYSTSDYVRIFKNEDQVFTAIDGAINGSIVDPGNYDIGDYDADGDVDILIVDYQTVKILVNQGGLSFQVVAPSISGNGYLSTVQWRDLDGDTDLDIVFNNQLYLQEDGAYKLSSVEMPVFTSNRSWADVNNDGLMDMIAMRGLSSGVPLFLYINQGDGKLVETQQIAATHNGTALFFDADGDHDLDLQLNDRGTNVRVFENLFVETGSVAFEKKLELHPLEWARAVATDVNFDGKVDLIINGGEYPNRKTYLYSNTSDGGVISFSETKLPIETDYLVNMRVVDADTDGAPDLFMSGTESSYLSTTLRHIFKITFPGSATLPAVPSSLSASVEKNIELSWTHDSGDDTFSYRLQLERNGQLFNPSLSRADGGLLTISHADIITAKKLTLYGLPEGSYTWRVQALSASFLPSAFSEEGSFEVSAAPTSLVLSPLAYNGLKLDWSFTGSATSFAVFRGSSTEPLHEIAVIPSTQLTYTDQFIPANEDFEYVIKAISDMAYSAPSNIVRHSSPLFKEEEFGRSNPTVVSTGGISADIDNDGDYDLAFTRGVNGSSAILKNDGSGTYSVAPFVPAPPYGEGYLGTPVAADIDNDGDVDICTVMGSTYSWQELKVIRNNGGVFEEFFSTDPIRGTQQFAVHDMNYDGRPDLMYSYNIGNSSGGPYNYKLLYQQPDGSFADSKVVFIPDKAEFLGGFTLADLNDDGFTDVLFNGTEYKKPTLFLSRQGMAFQKEAITIEQQPGTHPLLTSHLFVDFTGDGHVDLLRRGVFGSLLLYTGNGSLTFENPKEIQLEEFSSNLLIEIKAADVDRDGLPDLILTDTYNVVLLTNKGNGIFAPARYTFSASDNAFSFLTDREGDADLDMLIMSIRSYHYADNYYYGNISNVENLPPAAPSSLQASRLKNAFSLSWQPASDDKTPAGLLTYNVEIKDAAGKFWLHPQTNDLGTFRNQLAPGNAGIRNTLVIHDLPAGSYTARVQSLDAAFSLSAWSEATAFSVSEGPSNLLIERVLLNKVELHWTDGPVTENRVVVERKTPESEFEIIADLPAGTTTFTDASLAYNKLYQYRVYEIVDNVATAPSNRAEWNTSLFVPRQTTITNVSGSLDVADIDGNGKMELLINGARIYNSTSNDKTKAIFENTTGQWEKHNVGSSVLPHTSSLGFHDINGDHKPDLFEYGYVYNQGKYMVQTFLNDGNKSFPETTTIFSAGTMNLVSWHDYDIDNDLDALVTKPNGPGTVILRNDGNGTFTETGKADPNCTVGCNFNVVTGDFDGDGDDDYFRYMGEKGGFVLWININGQMARSSVVISAYNASLSTVDYNGDGWLDLYLSASETYSKSRLFKNEGQDDNGLPKFSMLNHTFPIGSVSRNWADFDHDGDLDLFTASWECSVFLNQGNDVFLEHKIPVLYASNNQARTIDYDQDGDLDIYMQGSVSNTNFEGYDQPVSFVVYNQLIEEQKGVTNMPPEAPANMNFHQDEKGAHFTWDLPADDHTLPQALTYDVVLFKDGKEFTKGALDPATGNRYKLQQGYQRQELLLNNLPVGDYTWRVQAVDQSYAGSAMTASASFHVIPSAPLMKDTVIYRCDRQIALTAVGSNIEWYSDEALTTKIASGVFSPMSSQRVYVTQTVSGVRGVARVVDITVHDRTEKPVLLNAEVTFCEGSNTALYLQAQGEDLQWYKDAARTTKAGTGPYISVPAEGRTYFVTQTKQDCESLPAEAVVAQVVIDSEIYYEDGNLQVAERNGTSYQWYLNNSLMPGATGYAITNPEPGLYQVRILKAPWCSESSQPFLITSVEAWTENVLAIFPNPAEGNLTIRMPHANGSLEIADVAGRVFLTSVISETGTGSIEVDTSSWTRGVYLATFVSGKEKVVRKFVLF